MMVVTPELFVFYHMVHFSSTKVIVLKREDALVFELSPHVRLLCNTTIKD